MNHSGSTLEPNATTDASTNATKEATKASPAAFSKSSNPKPADKITELGKEVSRTTDLGLSGATRERAKALLEKYSVEDLSTAFKYYFSKNPPKKEGEGAFVIQAFFGNSKGEGCGADYVEMMLSEEKRQAAILAKAEVPANAKPLYEASEPEEEEYGGTGLLDPEPKKEEHERMETVT